MKIFACTPYEYNKDKIAYNKYELVKYKETYVWVFISSQHFEPVGYILENNDKLKPFSKSDLEGEYFGNPSQ